MSLGGKERGVVNTIIMTTTMMMMTICHVILMEGEGACPLLSLQRISLLLINTRIRGVVADTVLLVVCRMMMMSWIPEVGQYPLVTMATTKNLWEQGTIN